MGGSLIASIKLLLSKSALDSITTSAVSIVSKLIERKINKMENIRARNYFLTINENAECFNNLEDYIKSINCKYAYIVHTDTDNLHYHLVLLFQNPRYLSNIKKIFSGAHIENIRDINLTCRYLLHLDEDDKKVYSISNVKTNFNFCDYIDFGFEYFNPNNIIEDIENGCVTLAHFYKKYGCVIRKYITLIEKLIQCYNVHQLGCFYLNSLSKEDCIQYLQQKINDLEKFR